MPFDTVWTMKHELLDDYFETIELLKERYKRADFDIEIVGGGLYTVCGESAEL